MIAEFYNRIKSKIEREIVNKSISKAPLQSETTFIDKNSNWYYPVFAGPSSFKKSMTSSETIRSVLCVLKKLDSDKYVDFNIDYFQRGLDRFGDDWQCGDINTALYSICKKISVKNYMEIGVRRGRSMAMVASLHPNASIVGFDMWIKDYVGIENPGPEFVKSELKKFKFNGELSFINGNSKQTVPKFFKDNKGAFFDIITVDGDHTKKGANIDLTNVIPRLKVGGFLVFDDIVNPWHTQLKKLWVNKIQKNKRFLSYTFEETGYGVGVAIKKW